MESLIKIRFDEWFWSREVSNIIVVTFRKGHLCGSMTVEIMIFVLFRAFKCFFVEKCNEKESDYYLGISSIYLKEHRTR